MEIGGNKNTIKQNSSALTDGYTLYILSLEVLKMAKTVTVSKWGNAQGIRIPDAFCKQLGISVGDIVSLSVSEDKIVMEKTKGQYTLEARLKAWDGRGESGPELDWGPPVGKEMW